MGWVAYFCAAKKIPISEAINDYSFEVANFFRIMKWHFDPFVEILEGHISCRQHFDDYNKADPAGLTDIYRAVRFYYLQKNGYGGRVYDRSFVSDTMRGTHFRIGTIKPILKAISARLSHTVIENMDFEAFIRRYDRPGTLFYLDPPYYGVEDYYGKNTFSRDDFARLAGVLGGIKGRFILSLNDTLQVRDIFSAFRFQGVETKYTIAGNNKSKAVSELLIFGGVGLPEDHKIRKDFLARNDRLPPLATT